MRAFGFRIEKQGPAAGDILRVVGTKDHESEVYLAFDEYPTDCFAASAFRKVLPNGLAAWLSEVNMNPSKTKVSEPA